MSWRDRDWARFNDDERRQLFGGGAGRVPPRAEGAAYRGGSVSAGRRSVSRRRQRIGESILAAFIVTAIVLFAFDHLDLSNSRRLEVRPALPISPALPVATARVRVLQPPADVIGIHWRTDDLAPAARAGRICVTDHERGRICAAYVVGERPADNLTRELERRGLSVRSSG
ncbi:MAG TPA: hypothetical protein VFK17_00940 [Gaiellaceae bacterium]|jgi:hypothetical protein|nr:hypothetical protein [Gaiellaceae bacterium]